MCPGVFELADPSGRPAGSIQVTLRWKLTYIPPPGDTTAAAESRSIPEKMEPEPSTRTDPELEDVSLRDKKEDRALADSSSPFKAATAAAKVRSLFHLQHKVHCLSSSSSSSTSKSCTAAAAVWASEDQYMSAIVFKQHQV